MDMWQTCTCVEPSWASLVALVDSCPANHCGLRHTGWEKSSHRLTSRHNETAAEPFLNELLRLFGFADKSRNWVDCNGEGRKKFRLTTKTNPPGEDPGTADSKSLEKVAYS